MEKVTASPEQQMKQAGMTARDYLLMVVGTIDGVFRVRLCHAQPGVGRRHGASLCPRIPHQHIRPGRHGIPESDRGEHTDSQ